MNKNELIEKLRQLPDQIEQLVEGLSDEDLTTHFLMKADGTPEWTVAQNVHHLFDSHSNCYIRCKLTLTENHPTIRPYDQDAWAELPDGKSADISTSLELLHGLHTRWVVFFEDLSEADWQRTGHHPEGGDFTLSDLLKSYVEHGESHIDQITRTLAARN